jgi:hypothetical protein
MRNSLGGRAEYLPALDGGKLGIVDEVDRRAVGLERPIDREQDSLDAELSDRALQGRLGEVPGCRDVEMIAQIIAETAAELAAARERIVGAPQHERQRFSEVTQDDLELGKFIKHAAYHQA